MAQIFLYRLDMAVKEIERVNKLEAEQRYLERRVQEAKRKVYEALTEEEMEGLKESSTNGAFIFCERLCG